MFGALPIMSRDSIANGLKSVGGGNFSWQCYCMRPSSRKFELPLAKKIYGVELTIDFICIIK
jgi:hypothetical protein